VSAYDRFAIRQALTPLRATVTKYVFVTTKLPLSLAPVLPTALSHSVPDVLTTPGVKLTVTRFVTPGGTLSNVAGETDPQVSLPATEHVSANVSLAEPVFCT